MKAMNFEISKFRDLNAYCSVESQLCVMTYVCVSMLVRGSVTEPAGKPCVSYGPVLGA